MKQKSTSPHPTPERSPKIRRILEEKPHWIIRWGITLVFALALIVVVIYIVTTGSIPVPGGFLG